MTGYPPSIGQLDRTAPVPRRIRAVLNGHAVLDTTAARYVWEWPHYPQYYVPVADIDPGVLVDEHRETTLNRGTARSFGLAVGGVTRSAAVRVVGDDAIAGPAGTARIEWDAVDAWFEEDEQVFVHPRNPYTRVDALRSTRHVRIEVDGVVLADSPAPVMVFETGLPTRYYLDRTAVDFTHLVPTDTVTACPYKGVTSRYWDVVVGGTTLRDVAWAYDFPIRQLAPVTGMIAFYNEKVDVLLDGELLERPETHFT